MLRLSHLLTILAIIAEANGYGSNNLRNPFSATMARPKNPNRRTKMPRAQQLRLLSPRQQLKAIVFQPIVFQTDTGAPIIQPSAPPALALKRWSNPRKTPKRAHPPRPTRLSKMTNRRLQPRLQQAGKNRQRKWASKNQNLRPKLNFNKNRPRNTPNTVSIVDVTYHLEHSNVQSTEISAQKNGQRHITVNSCDSLNPATNQCDRKYETMEYNNDLATYYEWHVLHGEEIARDVDFSTSLPLIQEGQLILDGGVQVQGTVGRQITSPTPKPISGCDESCYADANKFTTCNTFLNQSNYEVPFTMTLSNGRQSGGWLRVTDYNYKIFQTTHGDAVDAPLQ